MPVPQNYVPFGNQVHNLDTIFKLKLPVKFSQGIKN